MKWIILLLICVQVNSYCTCSVDEATFQNNGCCGTTVGACAESSSSFNDCDCCGKTLLRSVHEVLAGLDYTDSSNKTITEPFYISYDLTTVYDAANVLGQGAGVTLTPAVYTQIAIASFAADPNSAVNQLLAMAGMTNANAQAGYDSIYLSGASKLGSLATIGSIYPPLHGNTAWPFDMDTAFIGGLSDTSNFPTFYADGDTEYSVVKNGNNWELRYSTTHAILTFEDDGTPAAPVFNNNIPIAEAMDAGCAIEYPVSTSYAIGLCMKDPKTGGSITNVFNGF